jgi:5-methylcytosine-specific restriction protein A
MPSHRPCIVVGCPRLSIRGKPRCSVHASSKWPKSGSTYDSAWRRLRNTYIAQHPQCEWAGCHERSDEVDHIVSVRTDSSRRLDPTNLQALCLHHHRAKTARASNRRDR